jgi:leader peptidase (prepilin peptidase) / N-methyltransferase
MQMPSSTVAAGMVPVKRAAGRALSRRGRIGAAAVGAIVVVLCFVSFGLSGEAFVGAFFGAVLVYLSAFDLEHRLIPNRVVLPATAVVLAAQLALDPGHGLECLVAAAAAGGFFLATLLIYPPGLGMGDVKLALLLGAALGANVVGAVLVGTLAAAFFGLALVLRQGGAARKHALAFGPFLAFGGLIALLLS